MKRILYVDMDNTMFDYYKHMIEYSKKFYNGPVIEKEKALQSHRAHTWFDLPEEYAKNIVRSVHGSIDFWSSMPQKEEGMVGIVRFLMSHFNVFFATSVTNDTPEAAFIGKIACIKKNFPDFEIWKIIFCKFKFFLKGDFIIDDLPGTLYGPNDEVFEGQKIIFDYPHNKGFGDHRVYSWWDIKEHFEKIL